MFLDMFLYLVGFCFVGVIMVNGFINVNLIYTFLFDSEWEFSLLHDGRAPPCVYSVRNVRAQKGKNLS